MSEAAIRERAIKQHWAGAGQPPRPAGPLAKIGLPSAVGVLIAVLALAPLDQRGDVSFILDKKKVDNAPERMRVEAARYVGEDNKGQKFAIVAEPRDPASSDVPVVDINGMLARLGLAQGPLAIAAQPGPLRSRHADGRDQRPGAGRRARRLPARRPATCGRPRSSARCASAGPVAGAMRLGQFRGRAACAPISASARSVLDGGARLKIVQGAVR